MRKRKSTMPYIIPNQEFYNKCSWWNRNDTSAQMEESFRNWMNQMRLTHKKEQVPGTQTIKVINVNRSIRTATRKAVYQAVHRVNN